MFQKQKLFRSKKIRDSARGQDCTMEIDGVCSYDPATVVFCHSNDSSFGKGVALKNPDWAGFYGCYKCHQVYDGHVATDLTKEDLDFYFNNAFTQTMEILFQKGIIVVKDTNGFIEISGQNKPNWREFLNSFENDNVKQLMSMIEDMLRNKVIVTT